MHDTIVSIPQNNEYCVKFKVALICAKFYDTREHFRIKKNIKLVAKVIMDGSLEGFLEY